MGTVEDRQARKAAQRNSTVDTVTSRLGHGGSMTAGTVREYEPITDADGRLSGFVSGAPKMKTQPPNLPTIDGKQMAYLDACILDYRNNGIVEAADVLRPVLECHTGHADVLSKCTYQLPPESWGTPEKVADWIARGGMHGRASFEQLIEAMTPRTVPAVFVFVDWRVDSFLGSLRGAALGEDGRVLFGRVAPDAATLRAEMIGGGRARSAYESHYKDGFSPVDLIGFTRAQLDGHAAFQVAVLNYEFRLKTGKP